MRKTARRVVSLFPNICLRLDALVVRNEGDAAYINMAAVNDDGTSVGSCTVKLTRSVGVLPSSSHCDLVEGGLGI